MSVPTILTAVFVVLAGAAYVARRVHASRGEPRLDDEMIRAIEEEGRLELEEEEPLDFEQIREEEERFWEESWEDVE